MKLRIAPCNAASSDCTFKVKDFQLVFCLQIHALVGHTIIIIINPILIRVYPVNGSGRIYPTLTAISPTHTLHLPRFKAFSFTKPTLLLSFFTCVFHVLFGRPCFLLPFTSNSNVFLQTCPSSLLNRCPYHLTPLAFAI